MAEQMLTHFRAGEGVLAAHDKTARYEALCVEIMAVTDGEANAVSRMASVACLLHYAFESFFWTGFYMVDPDGSDHLVVGPYQGTLGCLRIPFGRGVCGAAAASGETQIVADVDAFPGHIACSSAARSEIVVPVFDAGGALIAVLDVDSAELSAFDETDTFWLEKIVVDVFSG